MRELTDKLNNENKQLIEQKKQRDGLIKKMAIQQHDIQIDVINSPNNDQTRKENTLNQSEFKLDQNIEDNIKAILPVHQEFVQNSFVVDKSMEKRIDQIMIDTNPNNLRIESLIQDEPSYVNIAESTELDTNNQEVIPHLSAEDKNILDNLEKLSVEKFRSDLISSKDYFKENTEQTHKNDQGILTDEVYLSSDKLELRQSKELTFRKEQEKNSKEETSEEVQVDKSFPTTNFNDDVNLDQSDIQKDRNLVGRSFPSEDLIQRE